MLSCSILNARGAMLCRLTMGFNFNDSVVGRYFKPPVEATEAGGRTGNDDISVKTSPA